MEQLDLALTERGLTGFPCLDDGLPAAEQARMNTYCGFPAGFTEHDWCKRFFIGIERPNGSIQGCPCPCHKDQ